MLRANEKMKKLSTAYTLDFGTDNNSVIPEELINEFRPNITDTTEQKVEKEDRNKGVIPRGVLGVIR